MGEAAKTAFFRRAESGRKARKRRCESRQAADAFLRTAISLHFAATELKKIYGRNEPSYHLKHRRSYAKGESLNAHEPLFHCLESHRYFLVDRPRTGA